MKLVIVDSEGDLIDGRSYTAVIRLPAEEPSIYANGVRVCGVLINKDWFIVASLMHDEKDFSPIGPMTEDEAHVYLRLQQ